MNLFHNAHKFVLIISAIGLSTPLLSSCEWANAQPISPQISNITKEAAPIISIELFGNLEQSATIFGRTEPFTDIDAAGIKTKADKDGFFVFGFDRDAPETASIVFSTADGRSVTKEFSIHKRQYHVSVVNGLPPSTVNPPPEVMDKIQRDSAMKQQAFSSLDAEATGFRGPFRWPLEQIYVTSDWGAQRSLNGDLQRPHYGIDLRAPTGTPILAPAQGKVIIAQDDMHFEGGMVAIDHGQGLITNYLHMSKIEVVAGQIVNPGDKLGEAGSKGRANGPHLCWRMRWRGRQLDRSINFIYL